MQETLAFITDLLALSWSLAFSVRMTAALLDPLRTHIVGLGSELDRRTSAATPAAEFEEETVDVRLPGVPYACVNLRGIMVVFKPENWEVNRGNPDVYRHDVEWRLLSDWVTQALPRKRYPIVHSSELDFGFIHRLDVPSSGLVLTAKNFAGHALLRFQLDTHSMCREYVVVCVNPLSPRQEDVCGRLSIDKVNMKSYVCSTGAPARTFLKSQVYAWPQQDPDNLDTLLVIKILTGRHHQIRAHLTHLQHPTIGDGKYGQSEVMLRDEHIYSDMMWFESCFHRPVVPNFLESGPKRQAERRLAAGKATLDMAS